MLLSIYTPKSKLTDSQTATSVYLPTLAGDITILNNHNPIIGVLREGEIVVKNNEKVVFKVSLDTGYFEFSDNKLSVLIEKTKLTQEELEEIEQRAIQAKDKSFKEDEISEEEFTEREESEGF